MAQHGRELALFDEIFAVETGLGHADVVGGNAFGINQHIGLEFIAQHRKIQPFIDAICARDVNGQRVRLLLGPALHVFGAQINGKDLLPCDLGETITAVVELAATDPVRLLTTRGGNQLCKCIFDGAHACNDAHGRSSL